MDGIMPITFHMYSTPDGRLKYHLRFGCAHELKPSADVKPYTSANILKILIWHTARVSIPNWVVLNRRITHSDLAQSPSKLFEQVA